MTIVAGIFIFAFGAFGVWLIGKRFPNARFTRSAYAAMALGGLLFSCWTFSHVLGVGVAAALALLAGGVLGAVGALRRELRLT